LTRVWNIISYVCQPVLARSFGAAQCCCAEAWAGLRRVGLPCWNIWEEGRGDGMGWDGRESECMKSIESIKLISQSTNHVWEDQLRCPSFGFKFVCVGAAPYTLIKTAIDSLLVCALNAGVKRIFRKTRGYCYILKTSSNQLLSTTSPFQLISMSLSEYMYI
jgi:hypothetical protein